MRQQVCVLGILERVVLLLLYFSSVVTEERGYLRECFCSHLRLRRQVWNQRGARFTYGIDPLQRELVCMMKESQDLLFKLTFEGGVQHALMLVSGRRRTLKEKRRGELTREKRKGGVIREIYLWHTARVAIFKRGISVDDSVAISGILAKIGHSIACNLEASWRQFVLQYISLHPEHNARFSSCFCFNITEED